MIKNIRVVPLLLAAAIAVSAADKPSVSRITLATAEKSFDDRLTRLWSDNPLALVGPTRGVYLEGYGIVLTAEVNIATAPISLMHPSLTPQEKAKLRQTKIERLPQLKAAIVDALLNTASAASEVPDTEQIAIAVILPRYSWEDSGELPLQLTMQAPRHVLLEAQRSGGQGVESQIQVTEH